MERGPLMPWVRLDDHFDESPKIAAASDSAFRLWTTALAYANRNLSDGFIPVLMLRRLSTAPKPEKDAAELVRLRLWEVADGGYQIHDFHEYQPSKEQVLSERESTRQRVANWRAGKKSPAGNAAGNAVTNAATNGDVTDSPYPYPFPVPLAGGVANKVAITSSVDSQPSRGMPTAPATLSGAGAGRSDNSSFPSIPAQTQTETVQEAGKGQEANKNALPLVSRRVMASEENDDLPDEPDYLSDAPDGDDPKPNEWADGFRDEPAPDDDPDVTTALHLETLTAAEVAAYRLADPDSPGLALFDDRAAGVL